MKSPALSWPTLLSRWGLGMLLITWRYVWDVGVLHRSEHRDGTGTGQAPELPPGTDRAGLQGAERGVGGHFRRVFRVRISDPRLDAAGLMALVIGDFGRFVPKEVVRVRGQPHPDRGLQVGDEIVVDMPGPWNGPVRVLVADDTRVRLATLEGHLEAGQIEFRARDEEPGLVFEIEAWARPSGRLVDLLYSRIRLAKEIQLNMWVRYCRAAAEWAGGRVRQGVEIRTYRT